MPASPPSPPHDIHVLATDLRVVLDRLKRRLRENANVGGDLSWPQVRVLARLAREGPATVSALARAEGMRSQSMGELLSPLRAGGLLTGAADPADGRQTVLSLTPAALDAVRARQAARDDWLFHAIDARLTPAEQETLATAVKLLARLAGS